MKRILYRILNKFLSAEQKNHILNKILRDDSFVTDALLYRLSKMDFSPEVILDIGAYHGIWTKQASRYFPDAHYMLFEPQQSKKKVLDSVCALNPEKMRWANVLLGDEEKENVPFFVRTTGSSIYKENTSYEFSQTTLKMTTLDKAISPELMGKKTFIKLDVQGAELDVLKGASKVLETCEALMIETPFIEYNDKGVMYYDLLDYLHGLGFYMFDVGAIMRMPSQHLSHIDIIFLHKSSALWLLGKFE